MIYISQIHLCGTEITSTPGQYHVDQRNSNSLYKVLLNKLNAFRFIISFITAHKKQPVFPISVIRMSYFCRYYKLCTEIIWEVRIEE